MKWKAYTIHTTPAAEDLVADALAELGISGVEVRDKKPVLPGDTMEIYKDVMPEPLEDDGKAEVVFYLEEGEDETESPEILGQVRDALTELRDFIDIGEGSISESETEDRDWVNNWKEHFHAFTVDGILIKPTWVEKPQDDSSEIMIEIDPGTAFGTGSHETTQLCIHGIRKYMKPGDRVLDVGTGSGILGIIALKLGASEAFGTDIDELAVSQAQENIAQNGIDPARFPVILGDIIGDPQVQRQAGEECYDLVLSNILADIIIPLQEVIWKQMKPGAYLNVSGIINLKEEAVRDALLENPHYRLLDTEYQGEWVSFTVQRVL